MQETSQLYQAIMDETNHWFEYKVSVSGVGEYGEDVIRSLSIKHKMFDSRPDVGKAVAGEINITLNTPEVEFPQMATIIPYVRACDATRQSEWLQQGEFFIDTREHSKNSPVSVMTIHGYDAMLKAEQPFTSDTITGDSTDTDMVDAIAAIMGVSVDSRTYALMTEGYTIPLPTGYSCREVLGYIASMYCGCFIMSDTGELRLVSLLELPQETNYLADDEYVPISFGQEREEHQLSGQIVSFVGDGSPLVDLSTSFSPVQDLHGYDHPWPPGGGVNKWDDVARCTGQTDTGGAARWGYDLNGHDISITKNIASDGRVMFSAQYLDAGTYTLSFTAALYDVTDETRRNIGYSIRNMDTKTDIKAITYIFGITNGNRYKFTFTLSERTYTAFSLQPQRSSSGTAVLSNIQLEVGSTNTDWQPYSNECPISGWSEASIHVSPTQDAEDGTTYTIELNGTRYGGTVDVMSGVLTVTYKKAKLSQFSFAEYSDPSNHIFRAPYANVIPDAKLPASGGTYWDALCDAFSYKPYSPISRSDNGKYAISPDYNNRIVFIDHRFDTVSDFESANANAEIVYPLALPQTYQLSPTQVETLIGTNNVWSDTNGDTSLTYSYGGGECRIIV